MVGLSRGARESTGDDSGKLRKNYPTEMRSNTGRKNLNLNLNPIKSSWTKTEPLKNTLRLG